jgi:hypothetical protein
VTYIVCTDSLHAALGPSRALAVELGWEIAELATTHSPMFVAPEPLAETLRGPAA